MRELQKSARPPMILGSSVVVVSFVLVPLNARLVGENLLPGPVGVFVEGPNVASVDAIFRLFFLKPWNCLCCKTMS